MPLFKIHAKDGDDVTSVYYLNTDTMSLLDADKKIIEFEVSGCHNVRKPSDSHANNVSLFSPEAPVKKSINPNRIRLQLGLSCNYSCGYCSQRFVPHSDESAFKAADEFIERMGEWYFGGDDGQGTGSHLEFWGGEPLVYIKTIRKLAKALREKWPNMTFSMITNGSLFTDDIVDFLLEYRIVVGISHDGPGQSVRGPDPFDIPETKEAILRFYRETKSWNNGFGTSFNYVMNSSNYDRAAVTEFFKNITGDDFVMLGEDHMPTFHDHASLSTALTREQLFEYRRMAVEQIINTKVTVVNHNFFRNVDHLLEDLSIHRPLTTYGSGCSMEQERTIACNLTGALLTCQNVSTKAVSDLNGKSHAYGSVYDFDNAYLDTSIHWANRNKCSNCPVAMMCKGVCIYMAEDSFFETSCEHSYSDYVVMLAVAVFMITGSMPIWIEGVDGELPYFMMDVFGDFPHLDTAPMRKTIPIKTV